MGVLIYSLRLQWPIVNLVMGLVLGDILKNRLRESLSIADGNLLVSSPDLFRWFQITSALIVIVPFILVYRKNTRSAKACFRCQSRAFALLVNTHRGLCPKLRFRHTDLVLLSEDLLPKRRHGKVDDTGLTSPVSPLTQLQLILNDEVCSRRIFLPVQGRVAGPP